MIGLLTYYRRWKYEKEQAERIDKTLERINKLSNKMPKVAYEYFSIKSELEGLMKYYKELMMEDSRKFTITKNIEGNAE